MIDILWIARNHLVTAVRERITLFWFLIFPVFLLVILSLVFGQMGQEGQISFGISLVNADRTAGSAMSATIESVFERLAKPATPGEEPLFRLRRPEPTQDVSSFIEDEILAVRRGRRAALVVLEDGLSARIESAWVPGRSASGEEDGPVLRIYTSSGHAASEMAASIIDQVLAGVDQELLVRTGQFDPQAAVPTETAWVGSAEEQLPYVDFLLPGIVLMGFFMNGLFGIPGAVLFSRDQRVLRRYWVTPLTVPRYLTGLGFGHLALCLGQFAIVFAIGRFALGANVSFAHVDTLLILLLAAATFMAFGFLIAAVSKTAQSGMAIANILNMPMMFLSGLFFPIVGLPVFFRAIVFVNPVSYLADGLRASVGVDSPTFSTLLVVLVPIGWILVSSGVAAWRLRWDVGR